MYALVKERIEPRLRVERMEPPFAIVSIRPPPTAPQERDYIDLDAAEPEDPPRSRGAWLATGTGKKVRNVLLSNRFWSHDEPITTTAATMNPKPMQLQLQLQHPQWRRGIIGRIQSWKTAARTAPGKLRGGSNVLLPDLPYQSRTRASLACMRFVRPARPRSCAIGYGTAVARRGVTEENSDQGCSRT